MKEMNLTSISMWLSLNDSCRHIMEFSYFIYGIDTGCLEVASSPPRPRSTMRVCRNAIPLFGAGASDNIHREGKYKGHL